MPEEITSHLRPLMLALVAAAAVVGATALWPGSAEARPRFTPDSCTINVDDSQYVGSGFEFSLHGRDLGFACILKLNSGPGITGHETSDFGGGSSLQVFTGGHAIWVVAQVPDPDK